MRRLLRIVASCMAAVVILATAVPSAPLWAAPLPDRVDSEKIEAHLLSRVKANPNGQFQVIVNMEPDRANKAAKKTAAQIQARADQVRAVAAQRATKANERDAKLTGKLGGSTVRPGESETAIRLAVEQAGGKIGRSLPIVGGASASLTGKVVQALARNPKVARISEDLPIRVLGSPVSTVSTLAVNAPEVWSLGYTGRGVGVAVLDSGVAAHADLTSPSSRIVANVSVLTDTLGYVVTNTLVADLGGHGTHVAGIIAGNGSSSDGARKGIAPEANIVSVKVTNDTGAGNYSSVIAGVQWVVQNKSRYNIRVMNISLGTTISRSYTEDPLLAALEVAWFSGIVVVVAAGNGGPEAGTITSPGNDPFAITVGALDDVGTASRTDDIMAEYSSRGPTAIDNLSKPDLVAPGRKVVSLRSIGSYLDLLMPERRVDTNYFRLSGTSMAAPVVAGIAALLLQKDPSLSPNQVKYILTRSATPLAYGANVAGSGSVDALAAVNLSGREIANRRLRPNSSFARTIYKLAQGAPLVWRDPNYMGRNWADYTWETLPWDNYTWENFTWEAIDWAALSWSNYTWENFTWEDFTWESFTWENYTWEDYTWENYDWED